MPGDSVDIIGLGSTGTTGRGHRFSSPTSRSLRLRRCRGGRGLEPRLLVNTRTYPSTCTPRITAALFAFGRS
jgi:hypothetical protein